MRSSMRIESSVDLTMTLFLLSLIHACNSVEPVSTTPKERAWGPGEHEAYIEEERKHRQSVNQNIQQSGRPEQRAEVLTTTQVHAKVRAYLEKHTHKGIFRIRDHRTQETVDLKLTRLISPAVRIEGRGFHAGTQRPVKWRRTGVFTCAEFVVDGSGMSTSYDLDIWLDEHNPELAVSEILIHKSPSQTDSGWQLDEHFRLKDEDPIYLD